MLFDEGDLDVFKARQLREQLADYGMMRPVMIEKSGTSFIITHKCEKCGKTIRQHASDNDNMDEIIKLSVDNDFIFGK